MTGELMGCDHGFGGVVAHTGQIISLKRSSIVTTLALMSEIIIKLHLRIVRNKLASSVAGSVGPIESQLHATSGYLSISRYGDLMGQFIYCFIQ